VPLKGRIWNDRTLGDYAAKHHWDSDDLQRYIYGPYSASVSNYTSADRSSVMYYNPAAGFTTEKPQPIPDTLSARDQFIARFYFPFDETKQNTTTVFTVNRFDSVRIATAQHGFCFYPEIDISMKDARRLQMGCFFFTEEGENIISDEDGYLFDESLATVKDFYKIADGRYVLNHAKNDIGFYLPYAVIPAEYRGKKLVVVFKVFLTDSYQNSKQKEFMSKPFEITVPYKVYQY
jgi:hypothetical protein